MSYFISLILAFAVFGLLLFIGKKLYGSRDVDLHRVGRVLMILSWPVLAFWIGLHTIIASSYEIPAGNVGVVYEFGAIRGQVSEGFQLVVPWSTVTIANTQIQRHRFTGDKQLTSFSLETQTVHVQTSLNIRVSPEAIQGLYRNVGPNYFEVLVDPRVAQNFKDEIVKYESVQIAPHREAIRKAVKDRLEQELKSYSIEVVDLLLDNIDFTDDFEKAIERKQVATQQALEEKQRVVLQTHLAEQAVEKAKGEGGAIFELATKQALANDLLSKSITPTLVQWAMVQKLSDKIRVALLPVGQNFILDSNILKSTEK